MLLLVSFLQIRFITVLNTKTSTKIPVIVIFAPTASGKTALTRELFSPKGSYFILNAEIISADSQAVYNGMDIGTAKPEPELCSEIPHHLINIVNPDTQFTVADFVTQADNACNQIYQRGNIPVVCGGTGFYIRNFLYGLPATPESSPVIREQIQNRLNIEGKEALYTELRALDPVSAEKIHVNDEYRICRALEVYYTTGKTRSSYQMEQNLRNKYNFLFIILEPERHLLFERIHKRVDIMFDMGLENEVRSLIKQGYGKDTPGMKAIGYSEFFQYSTKEEIASAIKHNSCKYAKKQYTYIKDIGCGIRIQNYTGSEEQLLQIKDLIKNFNSLSDD